MVERLVSQNYEIKNIQINSKALEEYSLSS
jgi:hypothetical protein